jgi:hypothetical protein
MSNTPEAQIVLKIAQVSEVMSLGSGEDATGIAGLIVSVLTANPQHIERFLREGVELFVDGTIRVENGCLSYESQGGEILYPSFLRQKLGLEQ